MEHHSEGISKCVISPFLVSIFSLEQKQKFLIPILLQLQPVTH